MRSKFSFIDLVLLFFPVAMLLQVPIDPDLMWHLRVGQDLFRGIFPYQDIYTWSMPGYPWVDHEWLTNAIMFKVYSISGMLGLGIAFTAICLAAYLIAVRTDALSTRHFSHLSPAEDWQSGDLFAVSSLTLHHSE